MILPAFCFPFFVTAGGIFTALVPTFARSAGTLSSPVETTAPRDTAAYRHEVRKAFAALRADSLSQAQRALEAALGHDPDAAGNACCVSTSPKFSWHADSGTMPKDDFATSWPIIPTTAKRRLRWPNV